MNLCALCHYGELEQSDEISYRYWGDLKAFDKARGVWLEADDQGDDKIWLHEGCLMWSSELNFDEKTAAEEIVVQNPTMVVQSLASSADNMCVCCGKKGASIICETKCNNTINGFIHLPCATRTEGELKDGCDEDQRRAYILAAADLVSEADEEETYGDEPAPIEEDSGSIDVAREAGAERASPHASPAPSANCAATSADPPAAAENGCAPRGEPPGRPPPAAAVVGCRDGCVHRWTVP